MAEERDYLDLVAERLPIDEARRRDVLDELQAHLDDTRAELIEAGRSEADATAQAIARLGPAADLARDIVRAHQTPRALLSAVGWGAITTVRMGLGGWIVTIVFTGAAALSATALRISFATPALSVLPVAVFSAVALYLVGRRLPAVVAERSHRTLAWSARAVAAVGLATVIPVVLFAGPATHTAASIVAALAVPVAFAAGVRNGLLDAPSRVAWDVRAPAIGAFVIIVAVLSAPPEASPDMRQYVTSPSIGGQGSVGRLDARAADAAGIGGTCCPGKLLVAYPDPTVLAGYHDLRFELWPVAPGEEAMAIFEDRGVLLTVPARQAARRDDGYVLFHPGSDDVTYELWLEAPLHWTGSRDPVDAYSFFTGVDGDGTRTVLARADFETLQFNGNALEWIAAGPTVVNEPAPATEAPMPASPGS